MGRRGRPPRGEWRSIDGGLIFVRTPTPREEAIIQQWRDGATGQVIADNLGISRQRVQQILNKFGCGRDNGGSGNAKLKRVRDMVERRGEQIRRREIATLQKWGMTCEQYAAHVAEFGKTTRTGSPMQRFIAQRRSAYRRGIEWAFVFKDWWDVWRESGHWAERGRGQGYCMARYGDSGPYAPGNVYICTVGQNFSDSYCVDHPRRKKSPRLQIGATRV